MNSKTITNGILRAIGILSGIFLLGYFLYAIQSVIVYIVIAGILSLIARPIILFLRRKLKFPNTLAVVFTMMFMLGMLTGLILMFIPLVAEQGKSLSLLEVDKLERNVQEIINQISNYFSSKGIDVLGEMISNLYGALEVHKEIKEGTSNKEALNNFMKRVQGSIDQ